MLSLLISAVVCHSMANAEEMAGSIKRSIGEPAVGVNDCSSEQETREREQTTTYIPYHTKHLSNKITDSSCFADAHSVQTQWRQGSVLIMDVRKAEAYRQYHIPGSINLPLQSIKHKANFKNSNIVLVNKGLSQRFLLNTCIQLKNSGFNQVAVLKGGLKSWLESGYSLRSRGASLKRLSEISSYEYFSSSAENDWVFIDLDHSSDKLRSLIPNARIIELTDDISTFKKSVRELKRSHVTDKAIKFIAVNESGNNYHLQRERFSQHALEDIFYLSGGVTELQHYRQKHLALLERLKKGFQVTMGCGR